MSYGILIILFVPYNNKLWYNFLVGIRQESRNRHLVHGRSKHPAFPWKRWTKRSQHLRAIADLNQSLFYKVVRLFYVVLQLAQFVQLVLLAFHLPAQLQFSCSPKFSDFILRSSVFVAIYICEISSRTVTFNNVKIKF